VVVSPESFQTIWLSGENKMGIDIGSRLELFVDDYLIDRLDGAELRMHQPSHQGVALRLDEALEGERLGAGWVV
jgi:hypothetical protein